MPLLEVNNLTKRFGGLVANDRINIEIEEGEIVGLIGPNGAGKTTLFNCIAGFYTPDEGSVCFAGEEITGFPPEIQLVRVFKGMTVLDNVMVGAFSRIPDADGAREKALEVLEFVGELENKDLLAGGLTRKGITIFLVEHVMSVIMPISDRIIVLDYGKIIAEGLPQEIATNEKVIKAYLGERYRAAS